jgi:hypothetical protein
MFFFQGFFSGSLDVLYGGLGISKLQFLIKKISDFFSAVNFSPFGWSSKPWIGIGIQPKMLDPELNPDSMNPERNTGVNK